MKKYPVLGVLVNAVTPMQAVQAVLAAAKEGKPFSVSALATHGVMTGVDDPEHRFRLNSLDLVVPDGQPVRWMLNWQHQAKLRDRVYGPDLMLRICRESAKTRLSIYLYGSTEKVVQTLRDNLTAQIPGLVVAGWRPSSFRPLTVAEQSDVVKEIIDSGADMVFVGLGCPRQEIWVYEYGQHLSMPLVAVGAAFDFHAGNKPQAPEILQKNGLEWFYRWCCEPRRLFRRTFILYPRFVTLVLLEKMGLRRFSPDDCSSPSQEILCG